MKLKKQLLIGLFTLGLLMGNAFAFTTPAMAWNYKIKKGDSLFKIARRFGFKTNTLKKANRLKSNKILSGRKLWIPDTQVTKKTSKYQPNRISRGNNDVYLLARLISGEARGESYQGQVAVGAVILNRMQSKKFPNTVAGNVFKRGEFESVSNGQIWKSVTASSVKAAKAALAGWDPTEGALYFYNPAKVKNKYNWIWTRKVTDRIGRHVFAV